MPKKRLTKALFIALLLFVLLILCYCLRSFHLAPLETFKQKNKSSALSAEGLTPPELFQDEDMPALALYLSELWQGEEPAALSPRLERRLNFAAQAIYLAPRSQGRRLGEFWALKGSTGEALAQVIAQAKESLGEEQLKAVDLLELNLCHSFKALDLNKPEHRGLLTDVHRGVLGLAIAYGSGQNEVEEQFAPTYIVAGNRSFARLIELFCERQQIKEAELKEHGRLNSFTAEQVLVYLKESPRACLLQRGSRYVPQEAVNQASLKEFINLGGGWLKSNVHSDGRLTYKYWPASAKESTANNMIRQQMATIALIRYGKAQESEAILELAAKNLQYNLDHFYHEEGPFGLIEYEGQVKLGAVALAALAILEHPQRARWAQEEKALQKTILHLWQDNGAFTSFYRPAGDMRFQNFYPGEALLYLAKLYASEPNPALYERFMQSFAYYSAFHLKPENRNPAFVPWHTQAYYEMWQITANSELAAFIFTMNNWLIEVQDYPEKPLYPDTLGRFYDSTRPFGPPHAATTGACLEGLADAYSLATALSDTKRAQSYRMVILRGLRSAMQLQFAEEEEMYYISPAMRPYVQGGLRTTVYNNEIRCDNVQHNVMAALKIYEQFTEKDYLLAD